MRDTNTQTAAACCWCYWCCWCVCQMPLNDFISTFHSLIYSFGRFFPFLHKQYFHSFTFNACDCCLMPISFVAFELNVEQMAYIRVYKCCICWCNQFSDTPIDQTQPTNVSVCILLCHSKRTMNRLAYLCWCVTINCFLSIHVNLTLSIFTIFLSFSAMKKYIVFWLNGLRFFLFFVYVCVLHCNFCHSTANWFYFNVVKRNKNQKWTETIITIKTAGDREIFFVNALLLISYFFRFTQKMRITQTQKYFPLLFIWIRTND